MPRTRTHAHTYIRSPLWPLQEIALIQHTAITLVRVDDEGRIHEMSRTEMFGVIRSAVAFHTYASNKGAPPSPLPPGGGGGRNVSLPNHQDHR